MLLKLLLLLLFVGICIIVYANRSIWFSKLEGIGSRYQNVTQNEDAEDGDFSLTISGGVDYYADFVNNSLFILCDKYLYVYGTDGKLKDSRQHAYSNAIMKSSGTRCLLYSSGGTSFRVDSVNKMLYEKTMEQTIWFAVLSDNGYAAVVTESQTYACRLNIFDTSGTLIYSRDCVERLADVSFYGDGCITATVGAENGELITVLQYIRFDESDPIWTTQSLPTLCLEVYAMADGSAFVIGDTKAAYYSSTGALLSTYDFTANIADYDVSDERGAVLLTNEDRRQSILLLFTDKSSSPVSVSFDSICRNVILDGETAYVLDSDGITGYAFSGQQMSEVSVTDTCDKILKNGRYFYLLGYDTINRINVSGS
jgi:hypothetical protein